MSPRTARAAVLVGALTVLLLSACASEDPVEVTPLDPGAGAEESPEPSPPQGSPTSSASEPAAAPGVPVAADLTIAVDDGAGTVTSSVLTCEPAGGDLPDPQAGCDALATVGAAGLAPLKADQMCTMIYGGPQTATVSGTLGGQPVQAAFDRTNGCAIDRWDSLEALLGSVGD